MFNLDEAIGQLIIVAKENAVTRYDHLTITALEEAQSWAARSIHEQEENNEKAGLSPPYQNIQERTQPSQEQILRERYPDMEAGRQNIPSHSQS